MPMQRRRFLASLGAVSVVGLAGCAGEGDPSGSTATQSGGGADGQSGGAQTDSGQIGDGELVLATTTSTYDTGLLGALHPVFEESYGVTMKTIPKGTGASLRTARDGDADVILVHARNAEDKFMQDGFGVNRRDVMFNDFVIVGPDGDPAGINGMDSATDAFTTIAERESTFVSRGDDSGTNKKELLVWDEAGTDPSGEWYRAVGKGMGDTLVQASQTGAYTLADRGTYLSMQNEIELAIHVQGPLQGGPVILKNPYGVMAVNPAKYDDVNYEAAMAYIGFLTSPTGQSMIADYTANGSQLFFPNAIAEEPNFGQYVPQGYTAQQASSLSPRDREYLYWVDKQVPAEY
ncbi:tungstate transport system substrate-binding protein [Haloarcula vallismortis]|uniref:Tungstate transport system substrate-binding protein n=2 Tax=Haloarcula vallismortis TaxID=28442 RepID=A0A1H2QJH6_HALVA|nr:substrate-binding domain-containing protein [Haloarcula vallismortis]SDW07363.1 tungstate transport system substrate-binding protein [Haloarcula vallismortis]